MFAPWICVRPGALLLRIGRLDESKEIITWCRPRVARPITLILLSSCRLVLRSLRGVLVVTLAPASRQTLAAALSKRIPRPLKTLNLLLHFDSRKAQSNFSQETIANAIFAFKK